MKPESERTEEERDLFNSYQYRRQRKNDRSRERAIEKKQEIDRILSKPENKRTKIENEFLEIALSAKQRKNQGDRIRRQRLKQMKRAQARAESEYAGQQSRMGYSSGMSEIPMSPLPGSVPSSFHGLSWNGLSGNGHYVSKSIQYKTTTRTTRCSGWFWGASSICASKSSIRYGRFSRR